MNNVVSISTKRMNSLLDASAVISSSSPEGDDIGFLHPTFCQVGLPRSRVEGRVFERRCGNAVIRVESGALWDGESYVDQPLPYGTRPRLLLMYLTREYLRTQERQIDLGDSMRAFLSVLNIRSSGGARGGITGFKQQIGALAASRMMVGYNTSSGMARTRNADQIAEEFEAWSVLGGKGQDGQRSLWPGSLTISRQFAETIAESAVPLDMRAVEELQGSSLALDIYSWLTHRLCRLKAPSKLYWANLREQFGKEVADDKTFKRNFNQAMKQVLPVYPMAKVTAERGGIRLYPSLPPVPKTQVAISQG